MSHYATLFAHANRLGVQAVISEGMNSILRKHFKNISIPSASMDCPWNWTRLWLNDINQLTKSDLEKQNVMICKYVFDLNAFNFYRDQLTNEEFIFYPDLKSEAANFLLDVVKEKQDFVDQKEVIFVSVHVRRTDFIGMQCLVLTRSILVRAQEVNKKANFVSSSNVLKIIFT